MTELGVMRSCDGVSGLVWFLFYHVACFVNRMNLVVAKLGVACVSVSDMCYCCRLGRLISFVPMVLWG